MSFMTLAPGLSNRILPTGNINNKGSHGNIKLIIGPMFSGKSTELIRQIKRFQVSISDREANIKLDKITSLMSTFSFPLM